MAKLALQSHPTLAQLKRGVDASTRPFATVRPWRPTTALDEWVQREARPISLRQLTFFGRSLSEKRLLQSANYVRVELPTRLSHRLRDMQTLPYIVVTNEHISHVYDLYHEAFDSFRKIPEVASIEDNEQYCQLINRTLRQHLTVIPKLAMGLLECRDVMRAEEIDKFMKTLLKSRISRRVIAEQHLALTQTFTSARHSAPAMSELDPNPEFVGEVFLRCNAQEVIETCWERVTKLAKDAYGSNCILPGIKLEGHLNATFPYILVHLQYIIGELLRNSIQAVLEQGIYRSRTPPPIEVLVCEASQHIIIRISDQGGGIPPDVLPSLWSFSKGGRSQKHLENLSRVPKMAATMQEIKSPKSCDIVQEMTQDRSVQTGSSLDSLTSRPPNLRLGMGLPISRIYAEYWAGNLEIHNLDGFGVDAFLQISRLGNKNEQLSTRASVDAV